jgi:tRNA(adenine34) deaminase
MAVQDAAWMDMALAEAQAAGAAGDMPIGAVVLDPDGVVIARARNMREQLQDPTAHAEVLALRQAAQVRGERRLTGCTVVVTLEPCPMCAGAIVLAHVDRVVFGAWNDEYGAAGSRWDLLRDRRLNHRPEVLGGVSAEKCGTLVREFLAAQRGEETVIGG